MINAGFSARKRLGFGIGLSCFCYYHFGASFIFGILVVLDGEVFHLSF
jgi:hypothetical protein